MVLVTVLVLNLTGAIGGGTALRLFLVVEVPLLRPVVSGSGTTTAWS